MRPITPATPRSDEEIVEQTNDLARLMLTFIGTGYEVPEGHKFYEAEDPRSQKAWEAACQVQEQLTATDPNDALLNILPTDTLNLYSIDVAIVATAYIKATDEAAARKIFEEHLVNTGGELPSSDSSDTAANIPVSGRKYDDPQLPNWSFSPAITITGAACDAEFAVSETDVPAFEGDE